MSDRADLRGEEGSAPAPAATAIDEPMLRWFRFEHLPAHMQPFSRPFAELARWMVDNLPRDPERTVALRKLLESKDAAVRASISLVVPGAPR